MRPKKTMHRTEHRVEDIAIKAGKAHSLLVDTFLDASYHSHWARGCQVWCRISYDIARDHWVEVKHRYRHSVLLGDLGTDRLTALVRKREQ
jgi:hypothetical protein